MKNKYFTAILLKALLKNKKDVEHVSIDKKINYHNALIHKWS